VAQKTDPGFSGQPFAAGKHLKTHDISIEFDHFGQRSFAIDILDDGKVSKRGPLSFYADRIADYFQHTCVAG
jgi:hypothetical protein